MTKEKLCERVARDWLTAHPEADPQFSTAIGMLFNDNSDADEIESSITEAGEAAGYFVEPSDVVNAVLKAKKSISGQ